MSLARIQLAPVQPDLQPKLSAPVVADDAGQPMLALISSGGGVVCLREEKYPRAVRLLLPLLFSAAFWTAVAFMLF